MVGVHVDGMSGEKREERLRGPVLDCNALAVHLKRMVRAMRSG